MPAAPPLIEPARFEGAPVLFGPERIQEFNPQRFEFALLSGILHYADDDDLCVGFHDVRADAFWTRGHIPGRPIFPGVLIVEAVAQLCTCFWGLRKKPSRENFYGFGWVDEVRFRGTVVPPCRLLLVASVLQMRTAAARWETQAFVGGERVFEGKIFGALV
ncbi:MAG TPA: beta-hydroxyacyl-ACP dehydratase [Planctomycetota bacterium]|nr:beta-hydroxyacyl-ACP dehydratase [Planctomycetota bacterium]